MISALLRVDVAETGLPLGISEQAKKYGLKAGETMDISTGWDFRLEADRRRAREYLDEHKPRLLVGSPRCTMSSALQRFTPWTARKCQRWIEEKKHIQFVTELYQQQLKAGRYFLHEHLNGATS